MRVMRRVSLLLVVTLVCSLLIIKPTLNAHAQAKTYVVQQGDNLFRISLRFGTTVAALAQANNIANPSLIYIGQVLVIPAGSGGGGPTPSQPTPSSATATPGSGGTGQPAKPPTGTYTVQPGDTLSTIAARFGTTYTAIAQANNIVNVNLIFVGQVLQIAGATGGPAPSGGSTGGSSGGNTGGNSAPPPSVPAGFEIGGQVQSFSGGTQNTLRSAHMKWVKFQVGAGDGNGTQLVAVAHSTGFKVLLSVIGDKSSATNGSYQQTYAQYVASLAKAGADAIEIWNEENLDREWPTGQIGPSSYINMLRASYNAIKGQNGNTLVILGAPSPTGYWQGSAGQSANGWDDDVYYHALAQGGAGNYADCIGVHYNEGIVSPTQTSGDPRDNYPTRYFSTMLNRALAYFPGKKACFTELGYLTPEGYSPLPGGFAWAQNTTVAQQAQWLSQAASLAGNSGRVRIMIVFNIDFTQYGADPQAGYAIIRPGGGCPGCSSLASVVP